MKRPRLSDIAGKLQLSTSAVSLALRDSPKIPLVTRAEVRRVAGEIGYVYNRQAAELRQGVRTLVGLCINDLANPVFAEFARHIENALQNHGMRLLLWNSSEDREKQTQFMRMLREYGAAGALLCPARGTMPDDLAGILSPGFPITCFSRLLTERAMSGFANDDEAGAIEAVKFLTGLGHKRIAWIGGGQTTSTSRARLVGYRKGVASFGSEANPVLERPCETSRSEGYRTTMELLDLSNRPTAILAFGDLLAIGAIAACRARGLEVGRDISIVGYDDIEECQFSAPPLTTVFVDKVAIATAAVTDLVARIEDPQAPAEVQLFSPRIVVRGSTGQSS